MAAKRRSKTDAAIAAVKESDIKSVIDDVNEAQAKVQGTFAGLVVTLGDKIQTLQDTDTAIAAKRVELKELHEIEAVAETLEELKERRQREEEDYERAKEKRERLWADQDETRLQSLEREIEEHKFREKERERTAMADVQTAVRTAKREEIFRHEDVERQLNERVAQVETREEKMEEIETKLAAFDDEVKAAVEKQVGTITSNMKQTHAHELALLRKDTEAQAQLSASEIANLRKALDSAQNMIEHLTMKAADSEKRASDLATAAVVASGQQAALGTLQESMKGNTATPPRR